MEKVIIQVVDDKGRHRTKIFNITKEKQFKRYDIGHVAGYVQACMDHGCNVTWIEGEE